MGIDEILDLLFKIGFVQGQRWPRSYNSSSHEVHIVSLSYWFEYNKDTFTYWFTNPNINPNQPPISLMRLKI